MKKIALGNVSAKLHDVLSPHSSSDARELLKLAPEELGRLSQNPAVQELMTQMANGSRRVSKDELFAALREAQQGPEF